MEINKTVACCLCVRNCRNYLNPIFDNLNLLSKLFTNFYVIFVYDNCRDNSEELLYEYQHSSQFKVYVIHNENNNSEHRTIRIASSRNKCLDIIYNEIKTVDFHFVVDADDVNVEKWDLEVIKKYLNEDTWDALSFDRKSIGYYDIWALSFDHYKHHCWGFGNCYSDCSQGEIVRDLMTRDILNKLNSLTDEYDLLECWSAFNGFAIYRTEKFIDIKYDGSNENIKKIITDEERVITLNKIQNDLNAPFLFINNNFMECCEHIYYHFSAIQKNNARIRISKKLM